MDRTLDWLWLAGAVGAGFRQAAELLERWPDPAALRQALQEGEKPDCLTPRARKKLAESTPWDYEPLLDLCLLSGIAVLTPDDPAFPQRLGALSDRPLALYATGNTDCLNGGRYVGMVGTRRPTAYGTQACRDLSAALAQRGAVIVSGLADGLDGVAQQAAVDAGAATIAFLGTAIDLTYPAANRTLRRQIEEGGGCIVSEYPPHFSGRTKATFLTRNRLIAGLGEVLCVAEARKQSGTLNTVEHARRYTRPVLAVPGSIYSPVSQGTNELLRSGAAGVLCGVGDVLALLGMDAAPEENHDREAAVSADAALVLAQLGMVPRGTDALCALTGLPAQRVSAALMELEMVGLSLHEEGHLYIRL